jgi:hypothetical protein
LTVGDLLFSDLFVEKKGTGAFWCVHAGYTWMMVAIKKKYRDNWRRQVS